MAVRRYAEGTTFEGQRGYLAGLFDGEGWIGIERARPQGHERTIRHHLTIVITNNHRGVLEWIQGALGGRIRTHGNGWQWRADDGIAELFLEIVRPYLVIKADQAEVGLRFRRVKTKRPKGRTPPELLAERERAHDELIALNGRLRHRTIEQALAAGGLPLLAAKASASA